MFNKKSFWYVSGAVAAAVLIGGTAYGGSAPLGAGGAPSTIRSLPFPTNTKLSAPNPALEYRRKLIDVQKAAPVAKAAPMGGPFIEPRGGYGEPPPEVVEAFKNADFGGCSGDGCATGTPPSLTR
jgi:hypothetical protein